MFIVRTASTTTLGAQGTFLGIVNMLAQMWGNTKEVYFDVQFIPERSMFLNEGDGEYFRKRHDELAELVRAAKPFIYAAGSREARSEDRDERIADDFDARMAVTAAGLHIVAIKQLLEVLSVEHRGEIGKLLKDAFGELPF